MNVFWKALKSLGDTVVKCPIPISPFTEKTASSEPPSVRLPCFEGGSRRRRQW